MGETENKEVIEEVEFVESKKSFDEEKEDVQRNYRKQRDGRKHLNRENKNRTDKDDFRQRRMRRKVCLLCKEKNYYLDYKDAETVRRFINEKGKILPRRVTGTCAKHQREIAKVVKRGRHIGVLPYTID